jgi:hypothetical protein
MAVKDFFIYSAVMTVGLMQVFFVSYADGAEKVMEQDKCIKKYQITRDKNPWLGFTSSYKDEEESKKINSVSLKNSEYKPVPGLEKYAKGNFFIIGRNEKLHRIAVEASLFGELSRGDATRKTEERFLIGKYRDVSFNFFKAGELAEFLIESQIVNTYWHVEADFCLMEEENSPDIYTARYKGKHIYYTNCENEDPLDFSIIIEKKTGKIFLEVK